ncbi:MAG TPA: hypothetical protein VEH48_02760 [Candidatus Nitrosopolaris sp.]|nr:hypothetical protein [Candidatus Nitrosopolaris sp.]
MPPQTPSQPVSSPSPNPSYDFILRDPQAPRRRFSLPGGSGAMKILFGLLGVLVIVIIFAVVAGGGGPSNAQQLVAVAGRAQEIARVSSLLQQQSNDPNTQYLAATAQIALTSEQYRITGYLKAHKVKVSPAQLAAYQNKNTDSQLITAKQNNDLEETFDAYLKSSLEAYQASLQTASKGASKTVLPILQDANASTQVLLAAPEITSLSTNS